MNPLHFLRCILIIMTLATSTHAAEKKALLPETVPFNKKEIEKQQDRPRDAKGMDQSASKFNYRISGQIASRRKSSLSFPVVGFTKSMVAKAGTRAKKGEILALLDDRDYQLQLELAKANKRQAELQVGTLGKELQRERQLAAEHASTSSRIEHAEASFKQAQIALELASVSVKIAEKNVESTRLRAPYDCVVAKVYKDEAEHVPVGNKVLDINEINATELNLDVPASLFGTLKAGGKLSVSLSAVGYKGNALISRVVPIIDTNTRTFQVTAVFVDHDERVVPGLFAEAQIN